MTSLHAVGDGDASDLLSQGLTEITYLFPLRTSHGWAESWEVVFGESTISPAFWLKATFLSTNICLSWVLISEQQASRPDLVTLGWQHEVCGGWGSFLFIALLHRLNIWDNVDYKWWVDIFALFPVLGGNRSLFHHKIWCQIYVLP